MTTNDGHGSWTTGSTLSRVDPGDASLALEGPRYQQDRELGRGGHGVVQLCRDQIVGREIAVKTRIGKRNLSRFIREARIQGQLEHPAIVPVYDLGIDEDDHVYFSMKRLRGRTLRNVIKDLQAGDHATAAQFPRSRLLQIFLTTCNALHFAHSRGVLHRDIKPANIMAGEYGEVYVLDWGVATMLDSDLEETHELQPDEAPDAELVEDQETSAQQTADGVIIGWRPPDDHPGVRTMIFSTCVCLCVAHAQGQSMPRACPEHAQSMPRASPMA